MEIKKRHDFLGVERTKNSDGCLGQGVYWCLYFSVKRWWSPGGQARGQVDWLARK